MYHHQFAKIKGEMQENIVGKMTVPQEKMTDKESDGQGAKRRCIMGIIV